MLLFFVTTSALFHNISLNNTRSISNTNIPIVIQVSFFLINSTYTFMYTAQSKFVGEPSGHVCLVSI